jgi:anti-anti-sigma factor
MMIDVPLWSARVSTRGDARTVTLAGELDLAGADELTSLLVAELETPGTTVVSADLAAVTFVDSAALGALIVAYQHAEGTAHRFAVTNPTPPVRRILEISGVYGMLVEPSRSGDA